MSFPLKKFAIAGCTLSLLGQTCVGAALADKDTPPPFHIGSKFSRTVQKYTGLTMVGNFVASQAADHVLSKKLGGKVKVHVKSYSLTDLVAGKVKSVKIKTAGGVYKDVPIGDLEVASANPIWYQYHSKNGEKAGLKTPVMLDVKAQLDNKTVVTALESQKITQSLRGLKIDLPGLGEQQLQVVRPKVDIGENAIKIDALLITQGASEDTGVPLVISGTPVLKGDKVFISEMKVESPCITEPAQFATFFQDLFNPIFDFSRLDRKDHAFRLKQLAIKGDTIEGGGQLLLVPRNLAQAQPAQAPTVQPHPIEVQPAQAIPVQEQPVADKAPVKQPVFRTFITDHVSRDP